MITAILILTLVITFMIVGFCFRIAGGVLSLAIKLIFCLPVALICAIVGVVFCCTLILIPLGVACFKLAGCILNPFRAHMV